MEQTVTGQVCGSNPVGLGRLLSHLIIGLLLSLSHNGHNNKSGPSWHQSTFLKFDRADVQTHRCHHVIQHKGRVCHSLILCNYGACTPSVQRKEMQALSRCFFMHMEPVWELRISSLFSAAVIKSTKPQIPDRESSSDWSLWYSGSVLIIFESYCRIDTHQTYRMFHSTLRTLALFHRSVFLCSLLAVFSLGSLRSASWHVSQTIPAPVCSELPNDRKQLTWNNSTPQIHSWLCVQCVQCVCTL